MQIGPDLTKFAIICLSTLQPLQSANALKNPFSLVALAQAETFFSTPSSSLLLFFSFYPQSHSMKSKLISFSELSVNISAEFFSLF